MAEDRRPCDLVMKGGITSGLVYGGAVLRLKDRYRFEEVGGASAGAIAAALTAAAEYGHAGGMDGFARMRRWTERLGKEKGLLRALFQPTPAARPAFEALIPLVAGSGGHASRTLQALGRLVREYWGLAIWAAAGVAAYTVAVVATGAASLRVLIASAIAFGILALLGVLAAALGSAGWSLIRALEGHGFGMCPGIRQPGHAGPALGEWLHEALQDCAGRTSADSPLTFADLESRGVRLRTITTDLAYARPVDLPVPEDFPTDFLFDPAELARYLPAEVVAFLERDAVGPPMSVPLWDGSARNLLRLPRGRMPVLLAVRLSLSFPILLSTIRLWSVPPGQKQAIEHCFSDGGISSNFPIHFFDAWVPSRPTFGLDLQTRQSEADTEVSLPGSRKTDPPPPPRYSRVRSLTDFAKQVADAARNWHDAAQSELPGFRDRVCHIRLSKEEGGLNLDMDEETIATLMRRGEQAADEIDAGFDWDLHRFARYLTLMQVLQRSLTGSTRGFTGFRDALAGGDLPEQSGYTAGHEGDWCADAAEVTGSLLASATSWGALSPPTGGFDQGGGVEPEPAPAMRIVPDV